MKNKIIVGLIFLALVASAIAYQLYTKTLESVSDMKTEVSISANDLLNAFEENEDVANQAYLDKVIEVSGKVEKIEKKAERTTIYIATKNELSNVICQLESDTDLDLKEDDFINIKGICSGYLMDVVLVRCVLQ